MSFRMGFSSLLWTGPGWTRLGAWGVRLLALRAGLRDDLLEEKDELWSSAGFAG